MRRIKMNNEYLMHFNPFHDKSNGQFTSASGSKASKSTSAMTKKSRSLKSSKSNNKAKKRSTADLASKGKRIAKYLLLKNSKRIINSAPDDMQWATYRALNKTMRYL